MSLSVPRQNRESVGLLSACGGLRGALSAAAVIAGLSVVTLRAIHRLDEVPYFPRGIDWPGAFAGIRPLLPQTGWAVLKVSAFWGWGGVVIAGLLLTIDPALGPYDAILAGGSGLWVFGYLLGSVLGPIGLFNATTIWALLAVGTIYLWRNRPAVRFGPPSSGQTLTLLTLAIMMLLMMPVQLGSPVVPFRDALSWPSSAQRILTFHVYTPFDNDPYGVWGPFAQAPGFELFCATLALGSHARFAALAQSAAMFPCAALVILGLHRLGRTLFSDTVGGIATLLLLVTPFPRTMQSVRPTLATFALVGAGLALFLDSRRDRTRMAIGALLLGMSIPAHVIDGSLAMMVAAGGTAVWLASRDRSRFAAGVVSLLGASLFGSAEFPIGLVKQLPYPIIPLAMLVGIALILLGASMLSLERPAVSRLPRTLDITPITILAFALLLQSWTGFRFPLLLTISALAGLVTVLWKLRVGPEVTDYVGLGALALIFGPAVLGLELLALPHASGPAAELMILDVGWKLASYWCPYFLTLFAAVPFALVYAHWSKAIALFAVLTVLIYPWSVTDPQQPGWIWHFDSHSLVEQMAFNLDLAANGYWAGDPDQRWSLGSAGFDLLNVLNQEIGAGRITTATHVLHLTELTAVAGFLQYAAFSGINDDPFELHYNRRYIHHANSRVRPMSELAAAVARNPPYILADLPLQEGAGFEGYEEIFHAGTLYLFRRRGLAP